MGKSIAVSMPDFEIRVRENGETVRLITDCGFGREEGNNNQTPAIDGARLSSWKRKADYRSSTYPPPHGGARMNYSLFLAENLAIAFHEGDPFEESHGCIHLNRTDASWLFDWAGSDEVAVDLRGPHPVPGIRAEVYLAGAANMLPRVIRAIHAALRTEDLLEEGHPEVFDDATAAAVAEYQTRKGLLVDGKVGSETALRMSIVL